MALNFGDLFLRVTGDVAQMDTEARQKKVDDRLAALEAAVAALKSSGGGGADPRVDKIIAHMAKKEDVSDLN